LVTMVMKMLGDDAPGGVLDYLALIVDSMP
jgi:hypothetical protein